MVVDILRIKTITRAISKVHVEKNIIQLYRYGLYVPFIVIPTKTLKVNKMISDWRSV